MRFIRSQTTLLAGLLVLGSGMAGRAEAQGQNAVITGRVTSDQGQVLQAANVIISEMGISVGTNETGTFTITILPARISGQTVQLRARSVGFQPQNKAVTVTAGSQTVNFVLATDVNKLSEIVVTGTVGEGTERSKVPYAVSRLTAEEIPVPALDPLTAIQGKMPGVRIASTNGRPGATPEVMMRGPTSINASGRSQQPLFIVDGAIVEGSTIDEVGGLDIESVEVVKGAAGASLYGTAAANGVIVIKTKRGGTQEGVRFAARSEYGFSDVNSLDYGQPKNHNLQLDETGTRFCVQGSANVAPCSRTVDWMSEITRINSVKADTTRTPQTLQWSSPAVGSGDLQNVYQSQIWPGQYYNTFAQVTTMNPITLNSIDASGRIGQTRFFVSGSHTDNQGALKGLNGEQHLRGRVNLDYNLRSDMTIQVGTLYDKGNSDLNDSNFGGLLRGAPPGTNYLARDSLGRSLVRGGGSGFRPTGNGGGNFLYEPENRTRDRTTKRFLANISTTYFPAEWITLDALFAYDNRNRLDDTYRVKGFRTQGLSTANNNGNMDVITRNDESYNAAVSANLRRQLRSDLNAKLAVRASYERDDYFESRGIGEIFLVKDVYRLENTSANKEVRSERQSVRAIGISSGLSADYKDRYILEGTIRYDGSSLFGEGNRWAPFGRVSGVWRVSEEPFWKLDVMSDFRLRASRGSAGSTPRFNAQYEVYNVAATGITLGQSGNKNLKPETTTELEFGTDFTLFNRLGVEITHANGKTRDQLLNVATPASFGFERQWQNAGTLQNKTWELGLNLPVINRRDFNWSMRGTWDRTRTFITELFAPEYVQDAGTGQGTGSLFLITARRDKSNGFPVNRYGNIWGRKFYKSCGDMPESVRGQCGVGKTYQVNDQGWVVWVGDGYSYRDGITKNLWQTKLPAAQSPWNYPMWWGHPIIDRPLRGQPNEGSGIVQVIGNVMPDFRFTYSNNIRYKRLSMYALLDGTIGHDINNQGEGWGLLDFSSSYFDQAPRTVETAKPVGYGWRAGGPDGVGSGGFYDQLGPNNYNVEDGSYAKVREVTLSYQIGRVRGFGDWTVGLIGRNLFTFTDYTGYDPEVGATGGSNLAGSGLINQVDAFDFPTLRSFTLTVSTRF